MKAPEYKGPAELSHGSYTENCKLITLPEGYRFLKIGEKSRKEDFHTPFGRGQWKNNEEADCYGDVIKGHMWPQIRKVDYVRGPKGRFVSTKPAPPAPKATLNEEMISWVASLSVDRLGYIRNCVAEFKKFLDGEATAIMSLPWRETGNSGHWNDLYGGKKPTEADKEYVRACIELWEARAEEVTRKSATKPKTEVELLKDRIESLEKENASLKAWKAKVLAATI